MEGDVEERTDGQLFARLEPFAQVGGEGVVEAGEQHALPAPDSALRPGGRQA
jgi:hypothetical protein